ncbi:MAG: Trk system potassium transporter TrkA [Deltaproteobacteria bacterium]|jgi:trk system potassium uptake protein TrkA|nr:Trk system potassium transporter TrkA [Deltaproteobacteria bacterium]
MKVIVGGAGEVGFNIAEKLSREKIDVVLVDSDRERLGEVVDSLDVQTVCGSLSHPITLREAGLDKADLLVAVTGSDESNILACRLAQLLSPETRRAARVRDSLLYRSLTEEGVHEGLGLSFIIDPISLTVDTIIDFLALPGVGDVIDVSGGRLKFIGQRLHRQHPAVGRTLAESLPRVEGSVLLVVAVHRGHEVIIPTGRTVLKARDLVYLAVTSEHLDEAGRFFGLEWRPVKNVFVMGGGEVGLALAKRLEERDMTVKLIERSAERCEFLSRELNGAIVIKGDATDQFVLEDEGVSECDVFIAVGTDDEKNMVSCLLARRLGAANTITRVNRYSYAPLVSAIGLESLVSARVAAVSAILKHVKKGLAVTVATLRNEGAEVVEVEVPEGSKLAGKALMASKFPADAIVAAVVRGERAVIPRGETIIEAGDVLMIVARAEAIPLLEKAVD